MKLAMPYTKLFSRPYTTQYSDVCLRMASPEVEDHVPATSKTFMQFPDTENEGREFLCMDEDDWAELLMMVEKSYEGSDAQQALIEAFHLYGKEHVAVAQRIGVVDISQLSNEGVVALYEKHFRAWVVYSAYLWMGYLLNDILASKADTVLSTKNIDASQAHVVVTTLLSPVKRGGVLLLQDELSKLKKQGVNNLAAEKIDEILNEYAWIPCLDLQNDPWIQQDVVDFYKQLEPVDEKLLSFDEAAGLAHLSDEEKELFCQVRELAHVKDMRDVYRRQAVWHIIPFFEAVAERLGLSREDLVFYSHDELIAAVLDGALLPGDEIDRRKQGFMMRWEDDSISVTTDKKEIARFGTQLLDDSTGDAVMGLSASRGVVQGRVAIVRGVDDLKKVKVGDVLVAATTHPDFVPAMQRAAAFVTDEGGLTSHAAIVAREMNKPCVVGTKNATKALKDGDEVEVDADKGSVEKI